MTGGYRSLISRAANREVIPSVSTVLLDEHRTEGGKYRRRDLIEWAESRLKESTSAS